VENCIIIEGGGFKTGFTSGVLDSFIATGYNPFSHYIGISGGSVVMSYYLSQQYRYCLKAILILAKDKNFMNYRRTFGKEGYMDIDFLSNVANQKVRFEVEKAKVNLAEKKAHIVATSRMTGDAIYFDATKGEWISKVVASCTLPFVTKGKHLVDGAEYFDGGWSDAIPVKWAYEKGARNIVVVRTRPDDKALNQSWSDYFGSIYFRSQSELKRVFNQAFVKYNESIEFINNPPSDLSIQQIQPSKYLKSGTYTYSKKTIMRDYRYGVDLGLQFVNKTRNSMF